MNDADLDRACRALDRLPTPDVWDEVVDRQARSARPVLAPIHRFLTVTVALGVFIAAGFIAWRAMTPATPFPSGYDVGSSELGLRIEVPSGWHVLSFATDWGPSPTEGLQVSNVELSSPISQPETPIQASSKTLPQDGVALVVYEGTWPSYGEPGALPLSETDFAHGSAGPESPRIDIASFSANGRTYVATATVGPDVTDADARALAALISSIAVAPASAAPVADVPKQSQTYEDSFGWSIDVPSNWYIQSIDGSDGRSRLSGAAFSNEPITVGPAPSGPFLDLTALSRDAVILIVTHREGGVVQSIEDDSAFPLDPDDAGILPGPSPLSAIVDFRGDGLAFAAEFGGYPDGDPRNMEALREAITTIRFEPWVLGEVRNGFEAVDADFPAGRGRPGLAPKLGLIYVMKFEGKTYVLDVPDVSCEGQNQAWDARSQQILLEGPCYDDIRYNPDGSPDPMNAPQYQRVLDRHPVIRAHDGSWLLALHSTASEST